MDTNTKNFIGANKKNQIKVLQSHFYRTVDIFFEIEVEVGPMGKVTNTNGSLQKIFSWKYFWLYILVICFKKHGEHNLEVLITQVVIIFT